MFWPFLVCFRGVGCVWWPLLLLEKGKQLKFGPLYGMSQNKLLVLQKYLKEYLSKRFIKANLLPIVTPVIFIKKPGGSLCFCVNY